MDNKKTRKPVISARHLWHNRRKIFQRPLKSRGGPGDDQEAASKFSNIGKNAPIKAGEQMLEECLRPARTLTREAGVLFIINDYPDIALLVDADGVHVGQDDFPVSEVRRLIGDRQTDRPFHPRTRSRLRLLIDAGADYIGVGPIYSTQTKEDVCAPVGLGYLDHVVKHSPLPFVAIGGIKEHNMGEVLWPTAPRPRSAW